jgi:hypothetical protein
MVLCGLAAICLAWSSVPDVRAQTADKFYFWVTDSGRSITGGTSCGPESFVIEVDAAKKADIQRLWAEGKVPQFRGHIAATPAEYNKNYHAPGHPVWNWHVVSVDEIVQLFGLTHDASIQPPRDGGACDIAANPDQWIRNYRDVIGFEDAYITSELDFTSADAVANVSNRGVTGAGEKALITGLIIKGGAPRNVVVRALGPSLGAAGLHQVAANPKLELYSVSGRRIGSNADWKTDTRATQLSEAYPSLAPTNDKEAAMLLTLLPGTYTLHGLNEDGTEGVILLEAYDVDSNRP